MSRTERYLKRATLGLWGQRRREAQMELRGILEDKLWRFQFLGLTPAEAETRALSELGPASALARGLSSVHSVPIGVQGVLLACMVGVLGVQTVGAITSVRATTYDTINNCDFSEASLRTLPLKQQTTVRLYIKKVGLEKSLAQCRENVSASYNFLSITDIMTALKDAGVNVLPSSNQNNRPLAKVAG